MRKAVLLLTILSTVPLLAEEPPAPAPIAIKRASGPITIDGDLSDAGWQGAATIDRFYETSPGNNTQPKVKTIAYLTYDNRYFYIGVRCDDPDPSKIRAPYVERDNVIGTDDNLAVFLDTTNTKRNAMELRVNPRGVQADGFFNDANQSEDFSPDFFYDTAAKIDSHGWTAEYRIPFSSLRYPKTDPQTWNILIWRNYPREFRYAYYSAPGNRNTNCLVCLAQPIAGLTGLPGAGHMVAAPYVTGQETEVPRSELGGPLEREPFHKNAGLDVKLTPTANNAIDLTLNPDFSQVEADVAQITVNQRFAVFFPEKRPFFLEGFDIFDTPLQVAYTRTITAPRWGVRSTGKIAGSAYTILVTGDKGGGLTIIPGPTSSFFAPQDFKSTDTIARMRHDIGTSFIGGVFTDRESRGGGGHNRVFGPDFSYRPNPSDAFTGELLVSNTDDPVNGQRASSYAFVSSWRRQKEKYDAGADLNQIGHNFRADLGFLPQVGYREGDVAAGYHWYPQHGPFSFIRASAVYDEQQDVVTHERVFRRTSPGIGIQGVKNLFLGTIVHLAEQYRVNGKLVTATFVEFQSQIDPSRRFTRIGFSANAGERVDFANARVGHGATLTLTSTVRPIDKLSFDTNLSREWLDVAGGRLYTAAVERLKMTYSFSAKSLVRVIGQYVRTDYTGAPRDGQFAGSILYSYKVNWQTVLYVGYGDDRALTVANDLAPLNRSLFFKVSYAIQR